jgi:GT2 family glycosyltransferase
MGKKPIRVAIVTPVHNRREITLQCLRSLGAIERAGMEIHIVVVDDGSTDGTAVAIAREFPDVEVVRGDGNLWYTAGTNRAIEAGLKWNPDYILAINDDSVFEPMFLQRLVACAEKNRRSVIGPLLLLWDHQDRVFQVWARWDTWYGGWRHRHDLTTENVSRDPWEVEIIVGNCVLYPVESIREVGLMNERYFIHFGDVEYTPRMRKAGWRLFIEPSALVYCQPNAVTPSLGRMPFAELYRILFIERRNPNNLLTMFLIRWSSAPSRAVGLVAYVVTLVRLGLKWAGISTRWPDRENIC